jgi:hypothetical protein
MFPLLKNITHRHAQRKTSTNMYVLCEYICHFDISENQTFCLISTDNCKISVHNIFMNKHSYSETKQQKVSIYFW